ncbi:hypothetical protein FRC19_009216 [Serendipita sp. 401]|nr:hypothetical protein FRC19_009216 [Serendipita sp. 401]
MRATLVRAASAATARKPLIHFLGKRPPPSSVHANEHRPHPAAPQEIRDAFKDLFARYEGGSSTVQSSEQRRSSGGSGSATGTAKAGELGAAAGAKSANATRSVAYSQFWEAPEKLWKSIEMTDKEMETIMMGGAP